MDTPCFSDCTCGVGGTGAGGFVLPPRQERSAHDCRHESSQLPHVISPLRPICSSGTNRHIMPTRVYPGYKEPDRKIVKRIVVGVTILSNRPTLGRILKELRRHRNWTLREMSERSGIPVSTLSKVENDRLTSDLRQARSAQRESADSHLRPLCGNGAGGGRYGAAQHRPAG